MLIYHLISYFENVKPKNAGYSARCPCHNDQKNSLFITVNAEGNIGMCCQAGCNTEAILNHVGLKMSDLFNNAKTYNPASSSKVVYYYANGKLRKVRYYQPDGAKAFYWEHLIDGSWRKGQGEFSPGLYCNQTDIQDFVFLVEGEKDADTLAKAGICAVSLPNGANSKWQDEYGHMLTGKQVVIIPDNDDAGNAYADMCAQNLHGIASALWILDLKTLWPEIPDKADISDYIAYVGLEVASKTLADALENAAQWAPRQESHSDPITEIFRTLFEFEEKQLQWLIPGLITKGEVSLLASDGGVGKTALWAHIVASLSAGKRCILDPDDYERTPQRVLFFSAEDSIEHKLKRQLLEAGANEHMLVAPNPQKDKTGLLSKLKLGTPEFAAVIQKIRPDLCIIDPIQGYLPPSVNMASRNAMRNCMDQLVRLGKEVGTAFLVICHSNKRTGAFGRNRIADSADLWDVSRNVLMAGFTDQKNIRYLSHEKTNCGNLQETFLFTIDAKGQVELTGRSFKKDRDFMMAVANMQSAPKRDDCQDMIMSILERDPKHYVRSQDLSQELINYGFSKATVERARKALSDEKKIVFRATGAAKLGTRIWYTCLPDAVPTEETSDYHYINDPLDELPFDTT